MEIEEAERIYCVPLLCFRMLPTTVIRVTPFADLAIYLISAIFQGVVMKFLKVRASNTENEPDVYYLRFGASIRHVLLLTEHLGVQTPDPQQERDFIQTVRLDQHVG